jgi:hypothetical protein
MKKIIGLVMLIIALSSCSSGIYRATSTMDTYGQPIVPYEIQHHRAPRQANWRDAYYRNNGGYYRPTYSNYYSTYRRK